MGRGTAAISSVLACLLGGLALAGCSGAGPAGVVGDPIAQAAEVTERVPGYKVSISDRFTEPGETEAFTSTADGVFDARGGRGAMTVETGGEKGEVRYATPLVYTKANGSPVGSEGKPWIKFNLAKLEAALGIDYSALSTADPSADPSKALAYLRGVSGAVVRVGSAQVQGVPTTRYRASIDYAKYADTVPAADRAAAQVNRATLERISGSATQPVEVWVDAQQRVRRIEETFHECLPNGKVSVQIRTELSGFGVQSIPALPSSADVADVTPLIVQKLKKLKLGCS
jgi:hypothetical protein